MDGWDYQNTFLITMFRPIGDVTKESKVIRWEYHFPQEHLLDEEVVVCQNFLCQVLNMGRGRFRTIQGKIKRGEELSDNRGNHNINFMKLSDRVKQAIHDHYHSLVHSASDHPQENSSMKSFPDSSLTLKKTYELFVEFYASQNNEKCPIKESTYSKYFNRCVKFTFDTPPTDVPNTCYTVKQKMYKCPEGQAYQRKVRQYQVLKESQKVKLLLNVLQKRRRRIRKNNLSVIRVLCRHI